jgi:hypothetical protein
LWKKAEETEITGKIENLRDKMKGRHYGKSVVLERRNISQDWDQGGGRLPAQISLQERKGSWESSQLWPLSFCLEW